MINTRDINELLPKVRNLCNDLIIECKKQNINIKIISTYRDNEYQDMLFNKRPQVTKARGGTSFHNYRLAFDFAIIKNGKIDWNDIVSYKKVGNIGKLLGLTWGGDFKNLKDYGHFQFDKNGEITINKLQNGYNIYNI